mmetsp:Transcript_75332/g.194212  ORF Transcript_75332/g.194212 Transcript_75332/m.194212 type:complete len:559 (-) Transcript_75332:63-1739(-)
MGCSSGSLAPGSPSADVLSATKTFFQLDEVPLTVKASAKGGLLDVRAAGLDKEGLLEALTAGFLQRNFLIVDGSVYAVRGLFHAKFALRQSDDSLRAVERLSRSRAAEGQQLQEDLSHVEVVNLEAQGHFAFAVNEDASPSKWQKLKPNLVMEDVSDVRASTTSQIEELDKHTASVGAVVRLTLVRGWSPFIRVALQKTIEAAGYRVVVAKLTTTQRGDSCSMKDTFWLATTNKSEPFQRMDYMSDLIQQLETAQPDHSPTKFFERMTSSPEDVETKVTKAANHTAEARLAALPRVLRDKACQLPYKLLLDRQGEQFEGLQKYTGIGMAKTFRGSDVLEFASYYVKEESKSHDTADGKPGRMSLSGSALRGINELLGGGEKFGEFVTQYDPTSRCLTVFKVFLNGVLPAGKGAGARVVAEQLLQKQIHEMAGAAWDGKASVQGLARIHLCDVVNWNTYALMSVAGQEPNSDAERWLVGEEARASRMTMQDLKTLTAEQVFMRTVLGKMVVNLLKLWSTTGVANKVIKSVSLQMEKGELEMICGEYRQMMDIVVSLKQG